MDIHTVYISPRLIASHVGSGLAPTWKVQYLHSFVAQVDLTACCIYDMPMQLSELPPTVSSGWSQNHAANQQLHDFGNIVSRINNVA